MPGVILVLAVALALAGCGGSAAATPTIPPSPSPTPTPDPHLTEPASLEAVFSWMQRQGLTITANNADAGGTGGEPLRRINATYASWPLIISEFSSSAALARSGFRAGTTPGIGDAPFQFAGLNILVEYGPHAKNVNQQSPDPRFQAAAQKIADVLEPLIGPLEQSSVDPVSVASAAPVPSAAPPSDTIAPSPSS